MKKILIRQIYALGIIAFSLTADIISKNFIVDHFTRGERLDYLAGYLRITLVYNQGGVFGIAQGYKHYFLVISIIVLFFLLGYYAYLFFKEKLDSKYMLITLSLIISGAIGNIIDRLIPGRIGVVDFISIRITSNFRWPAFNVADSVIVVGAIMLIIYIYREERKEKKKKEEQAIVENQDS